MLKSLAVDKVHFRVPKDYSVGTAETMHFACKLPSSEQNSSRSRHVAVSNFLKVMP